MSVIKEKLEVLKDAKYKLLLIVGQPGSGKSKLIHEYSDETGYPIVNFNTIFGEEVPEGSTSEYITNFMKDFLQTYKHEVLLFDNKRVLYSKNSSIDLLSFLKDLSQDRYVIATWNGMVDGDKLIHLRSKVGTDLSYPLDTLECEYIVCQ